MSPIAEHAPLFHPEPADIALPDIMKALSDPTRLEIVRVLGSDESRERTCGEFECATKQLLSHHMRTLREVGLTIARDEGRHRFTRLRRETLDALYPGFLDGVLAAAERETRRRRRKSPAR